MAIRLRTVLVGAMLCVALDLRADRKRPPRPPLPSVDVHIVAVPPPVVRREVVVESSRPSADVVWVSGFWDWDGTTWVWVDGGWSRPPASRVTWVRPTYVRTGRQWRYVPGHWSNQRVIVVKEKVPYKKHHHRYHQEDDDDDDD